MENSLRDGNTRPPDLHPRNLYGGQGLDMEQQTLFNLGKEYAKAVYVKKKYGLKLNIRKLRSWYPVPSLYGSVETVTHFIFRGFKTTANGDCSHETERCLLLGRKVMTYLNIMLKTRDIILPT